MAQIIDGKSIASEIRAGLKEDVTRLLQSGHRRPGLAVILVGENPASQAYVGSKVKACEEIGFYSSSDRLSADVPEEVLLNRIKDLNSDPLIDGILVQMPLPGHISEKKVIETIDYRKDVDGFHPVNAGKLVIGEPCFAPCTPAGILVLLEKSGNLPSGKHVVVVGRSNIVGKPVANLLIQKTRSANATVTICHTGTQNLSRFTRQADILIAAAGKPESITADMIQDGAVLIDVGINRVPDPNSKTGYRLTGDIDFAGCEPKCAAITPVPGGVGPMTIAMLMKNTFLSATGKIFY
ncbi:MAG: bifunctional methylenetetrahydrofolate dehydrogenase/methenyltetrahydrofolate cyclohydrolase FolD [Bacteroidetes bacterium]|nr:bifunctional methylenetetrahydrofolate dehydrogenase/methenyltetrahydrofolate cyclohydrolase FolD [Bacteroidota bacterium]